LDGSDEGPTLGSLLGKLLGPKESVGETEGILLGSSEGEVLGCDEGVKLGNTDGASEIWEVGTPVGLPDTLGGAEPT
jgi:hypothetical protein